MLVKRVIFLGLVKTLAEQTHIQICGQIRQAKSFIVEP